VTPYAKRLLALPLMLLALAGCASYSALPLDKDARPRDSLAQLRHEAPLPATLGVDDIAEFTELGDYLQMPLRTYSTGMRVRLALGVVTTIDPEILILDEGIGAVDAAFLNKARDRLVDLVRRSGLLVFASHADDLLLELCTTAIWMDEGRMRLHGSLREVLTAYKGRDPYENMSPEIAERLGIEAAAASGRLASPPAQGGN